MNTSLNTDRSRRALAIVNDFAAAKNCPEGWKRYRLPGNRFFAPATPRAWRRWCLLQLGNLGLVALAVLAVWAYLAQGAAR